MSAENWKIMPMSDSKLHAGQFISAFCGLPLREAFMSTYANSAGEMGGALDLCHLMEEKPPLVDFNGVPVNCFSTLMLSDIDPQRKQVQETQLMTPYLPPNNYYGSSLDMFHVGEEQSVDCFSHPQIFPFDGRINSSLYQSFSDIINPSASAAVVETPVHHVSRHLFNYCDDFACHDEMLTQDSDNMTVAFYNNSVPWQSESSITDHKNSGQIEYTHTSINNKDSKEHELQLPVPRPSLKRCYTENIEDGMQPCAKKSISWTSGRNPCSTVQSKCPKLKSSRAKQGSAMDPQSVAARLRRERISERLKILQDLVPNGSKFDLVTMLEKAINYVKFLQLQVKVLTTDEYWPNKDNSTTAAIVKVQDVLQEIASTRTSLAEIKGMDNINKMSEIFE
ncbi:hypothetical protein KI387_015108, partial [Taxus chinensis]